MKNISAIFLISTLCHSGFSMSGGSTHNQFISKKYFFQTSQNVINEFPPESALIPDNDPLGNNFYFYFEEDQIIESASLSVDITHTYISDVMIKLIHPNQLETVVRGRSEEGCTKHGIMQIYGDGGLYSQVLEITKGLSTKGLWKINISDLGEGSEGHVNYLELSFKVRDR